MKIAIQSLQPLRLISLVAILLASGGLRANAADDDLERYFENHVRPILVEHCSDCHGSEKQSGGLRVDSWQSLSTDSDSAPVVIPNDVDQSLLIQAVRREDGLAMPPDQPLASEDVAVLVHWVKIGAPWPKSIITPEAEAAEKARKHWAFQPIAQPSLPAIGETDWPKMPIDSFVLDQLNSHDLAPSPRADLATLIRRASIVLTGLPPSSQQIDAVLASSDPDAYQHWVEELLASPHYGEQWGRHWLDVARYSDSKGYVYAREERFWTHAWNYRDWVVKSFNEDRPINEFLVMQIAADQVATSDDDLAAMGFLTLGRRFLGVKHDIIDDRIDVVCRGMMGMTVGCARCHDHKFDPIPIKDYYSLYGVFDSSTERERSVSAESQLDPDYLIELRKREKALADRIAAVRLESAQRVRSRVADYLTAQFELEKYPDDTFGQLFQKTDLLPSIVRRWEDHLNQARQNADPIWSLWHQLSAITATAESDFVTQASAICDAAKTTPLPRHNPLVVNAFHTPPQSHQEIASIFGAVFEQVNRQVLAALGDRPPSEAYEIVLADADAEAIRQVLYDYDSPCEIDDEPIVEIESFLDINSCQELWKLQGEVERWAIQSGGLDRRARILVDRSEPIEPRVFKRGNPLRKDVRVPRKFLSFLSPQPHQPFSHGSGRLELANEIVAPHNPLTARVFVNRVWGNCFGNPLVDTPSDFGLRASPPSHPELLDWLASQFMSENWSLKQLHRHILLSATFQQSDSGPEDAVKFAKAREKDPTNAMLWRWNPRRLTMEEMRDSLLVSTQSLDRGVGGKPSDLWKAPFPKRRTIYGMVDRQFLPGLFRVFDFANPDLHIAQRSETTTPQQALFFLNHPWVIEQTRALAAQSEDAADPQQRVQQMFRAILLRAPRPDELSDAIEFVSTSTPPMEASIHAAAKDWSYGYGSVTDDGKTIGFTPLPHFTGDAWQGGPQFPDSALGWVQLTATGGHPGNDRKHAVIRRWTAPKDTTIRIESILQHEPPQGDGIRAFIIHSGTHSDATAQCTAHMSMTHLDVASLSLMAGETIDFIVDIGDGLAYDQFLWRIKIVPLTEDSVQATAWDSVDDFFGNAPDRLDVWEQLAQVLISTNEFLFVP